MRMYVCMYVCMYARVHVCIYISERLASTTGVPGELLGSALDLEFFFDFFFLSEAQNLLSLNCGVSLN